MSSSNNHITIEPVLEVFGEFDTKVIFELREVIYRNFAQTDNYGLISTFMLDFSSPFQIDYIKEVVSFFDNPEVYCIELNSPLSVRLERNKTENRLLNKPSKRNLEESNKRVEREEKYTCTCPIGKEPFKNYLRIDNTNISPEKVAEIIKDTFNL